MTFNIKKLATDFVTAATAVAATLAIVLNVATSVHLPASDIAIVVAIAGALHALVKAVTPYATTTVKSVFK